MANPTTEKQNTQRNSAEEVTMSEAFDQIKDASASVYDAVGSVGSAGAANARHQVDVGRERAREYGERAESVMKERPLVTVGVAFAAGWLVSRLMTSNGRK